MCANESFENCEHRGAHCGDWSNAGHVTEPDDIGGIAVFLASRAGAFVTGQTIVADGGVTIT